MAIQSAFERYTTQINCNINLLDWLKYPLVGIGKDMTWAVQFTLKQIYIIGIAFVVNYLPLYFYYNTTRTCIIIIE